MELAIKLNSSQTPMHGMTVANSSELQDKYAALAVRSMDDITTNNVQTLAQLEQSCGRDAVKSIIMEGIVGLLSFLSLKEYMNPTQIEITAELILDSYPNIGLDAVKLFFKRACKGDFGTTYGTMDGQKICIWFDKFYREYWDYIYEQSESKKEDVSTKLQKEDGEQPIDYDTFFAMTHPREKEMRERDEKIKEIRSAVQKECMPLYSQMSPEEANKILEERIIEEMQKQNLLTF